MQHMPRHTQHGEEYSVCPQTSQRRELRSQMTLPSNKIKGSLLVHLQPRGFSLSEPCTPPPRSRIGHSVLRAHLTHHIASNHRAQMCLWSPPPPSSSVDISMLKEGGSQGTWLPEQRGYIPATNLCLSGSQTKVAPARSCMTNPTATYGGRMYVGMYGPTLSPRQRSTSTSKACWEHLLPAPQPHQVVLPRRKWGQEMPPMKLL